MPLRVCQEVGVRMRSSLEHPQQSRDKGCLTLVTVHTVQIVHRPHRYRRTRRTPQVQRGIGHRAEDALLDVRVACVLDAVGAHSVLAATAQWVQIRVKRLANRTVFSKCHVLPLHSPAVLQNVELCVRQQHAFRLFSNALTPAP